MTNNSIPRLSVNLPDDLPEKLDFVCRVRNMTRTELIQQFIINQYEICNENSEVGKALRDMEALTKKLEDITSKLSK